ncbi:MAG TPA: hypothetical protein PLZ94_10975 [Armatimonadota bacterium]|nr:hypothetical protein [Armatimonadota bacterium]HPO71124.1 hypothetical protein [Armatimonadota bacterium]
MNKVFWTTLCALLLGLALLPGAANAQDRDGDGLPDEIEVKLGTDPDRSEGLQLLIDDRARGVGDTTIRADGKAPDIDKVFFAHAGGDRYVWKITFHDDYPATGTILHLYADLDDDRTTGRQDTEWARGVDVMYSFVDAKSDPRILNPAVRVSPAIPVRAIVQGNAVYICDDVKMRVVDGKTRFRMHILSHLRNPATDSDTTEWIMVQVPLNPDRTPPELPYPRPEGFESITLPDFAQLAYSLWQERRTVRLRPRDAEVTGYTLLMSDDFDGQGEPGESVIWKCPRDGSYYIGLILRDATSALEGLDVWAGERKLGTIVGSSRAGREVLHYTERPVRLSKGQPIRVATAKHSGPVRFHSVCLLAEKPKVPPLAISNLTAWHLPDEPGERPGRVMIAFTTNRPATASARYTAIGAGAPPQEGTFDEGRGPVNNHYFMLPAELRAPGYRLEIRCEEPRQEEYEAQSAKATYTVWRDPERHRAEHGIRTPARETPARIPLSVQEPTDRARAAWPVTSGVPLPEGLLRDPQRCRLLDASGKSVPAQFQALAWWPASGTVKWLQVSFLASTTPGQSTSYTLECGTPGSTTPNPIRVTASRPQAGEGVVGEAALPVTVNTGPLELTLDAGGFAPFAQVTLNGKRVGSAAAGEGGFEIIDEKGTIYSSALAPPDQVLIEEQGPVRAVVFVRGKLVNRNGEGFMRYLCRMHFHAGRPAVQVAFTLENDVMEPEMTRFQGLRARVPAQLAGWRVACGTEDGSIPLRFGSRLLQDRDDRFTADGREGRRAAGWILASGAESALAIAVRDFWQLYPKAIGADERGIVVDLLPELPHDVYAGASEDEINKLYFWCDEGRYKIRTGVRVTTELAVDFAPEVQNGRYLSGAHWQHPLFAACTPEWYCASGAFGPMVPRAKGKFEVYERKLDEAFAKFLARREMEREYGFLNYGDWFGERRWNWGNVEYDTQWALAANFARTGNLEMLWRAEQAERHNADVDTIHAAANPNLVGQVYTHCTGHTGGYFPETWKGMGGFNRGPRDSGHTWAQGHFTLYALTGERRFLETGRKIADRFALSTTDFRYYAERNAGWPLIGLMGAYTVDGNPAYLNAARLIADSVLWTQHPERGGWGHFLDPNECKHQPRCWGCKPFMTGVLLHGLKMYDRAQPREEIKNAIRRNADFLWRETYVPEHAGFAYSECKTFITRGQNWTISLVGDGLAYACLVDPEHKNRELLKQATAAFMHRSNISDFGKGFTQGTCFLPAMLHDLDALGLTEIPPPAEEGPKP